MVNQDKEQKMMYRYVIRGAIAIFCTLLVSACGGTTVTPDVSFPAETNLPAPALPTAAQPEPTEALEPTGAAQTASPGTDPVTTPDGTVSPTVTSTQAQPVDLPFLMRIDRISNIVGRGTLLEGQVAHGTLPANASVQILSPQGQTLSPTVLALLISNVVRDQVAVGDYAGILVEGVDPTQLSPGVLLIETDAYESYEEALQALQ
jgi:hypothetical protein